MPVRSDVFTLIGLRSPFSFTELRSPDAGVAALFSHAFGTPPPDYPSHFVARYQGIVTAGYIHYIEHLPGVYLCGGLCIDTRVYRTLSRVERAIVKRHGSLSRWLLNESIGRLPNKRAVFAYTGNRVSERDGFASDFVRTAIPHVIVQWHCSGQGVRTNLLSNVAGLGPF